MSSLPTPASFFIGIAEFFGSVVPGMVLIALLWRLEVIPGFSDLPRHFIGFEGPAQLAALLAGGYLIGNLVSVIGAPLDTVYDVVRKLRHPLAKDTAYLAADRLRNAEFGSEPAPMNVFQWSRAVLALEHPGAFDEVTRYVAASKLFRSMVVVSIVVAIAAAIQSEILVALLAVSAAVLSFWPYVDRRYKSTETAYRLVIVLRMRGQGGP